MTCVLKYPFKNSFCAGVFFEISKWRCCANKEGVKIESSITMQERIGMNYSLFQGSYKSPGLTCYPVVSID